MKVIVYKQPNKSKSVQLSRALHGYTDKSNYGGYTYKREGLLNKIKHKKLFNGVFLVRNEDAEKFIEVLEKYNVTYYVGTLEHSSDQVEL